ncbi:polysaccharide pyruvyl transferase family protein [Luedemannella flava]
MWARLLARSGRSMVNFGDELNPLLVGRLLGRPVRWTPPDRAALVAIGSVVEHVPASRRPPDAPPVTVWGSGLRDRPGQAPDVAGVRFAAVRGPLTRDALGLPADTPLGDPGLLVPVSLPAPRRVGRADLILVPHYADFESRSARQAMARLAARGVQIVPTTTRTMTLLDRLASADLVLASALHGLIVADAYGVPAVPVHLGGGSTQPLFKYADYAASVGLTHEWLPIPERVDAAALIATARARAEERRAILATTVPERQHDLTVALDVLDAMRG